MAGFSNGSYAKVWEVKPVDGKDQIDLRISVSSKNKATGEYKTDFSGFVRCYSNAAQEAKRLKQGDRVKLISTNVTSTYNKEKNETKYYFSLFALEPANQNNSFAPSASSTQEAEGDSTNVDSNYPF